VAAGSEEVLHYVRDALGSVLSLLDTVAGVAPACCRSSVDVSRTARVHAAEEQRHTTTIMRWRRRKVRQCYLPLHMSHLLNAESDGPDPL